MDISLSLSTLQVQGPAASVQAIIGDVPWTSVAGKMTFQGLSAGYLDQGPGVLKRSACDTCVFTRWLECWWTGRDLTIYIHTYAYIHILVVIVLWTGLAAQCFSMWRRMPQPMQTRYIIWDSLDVGANVESHVLVTSYKRGLRFRLYFEPNITCLEHKTLRKIPHRVL